MQKQTGFNAADYESIAKLLLEKSRKLLEVKDAEFRYLRMMDVLGERYRKKYLNVCQILIS